MRDDRRRLLQRLAVAAWVMVLMGSTAALGADTHPPLAPLPALKQPNPARVELGRYLFFDTRISGDGSISCATCHDPSKGWTDGLPLSKAYPGSEYFRNAKTVLNAVHANVLYWDGRLATDVFQTHVRDHITETHFMNMDGRLMQERIKQIPEYVKMFKEAWGAEPSFGKIRNSIRDFEKTLVSRNVPFDRFMKGDKRALSAKAKKGLALFKGKAGCVRCHNGAYLSDGKPYDLGVPANPDILNNPMRHFTMRSVFLALGVPGFEYLTEDVGYFTVSKVGADKGKFVTPTLREVSRTAPYMHNGMLNTLEEVIEFYNRGGGKSTNKTSVLKPLRLTAGEKAALVKFLKSLSGDEVIVSEPKLPEYQLIKNWLKVRN
ncbi:MAG: cytochrome c peroxidase [bacterium]|nr:cytochrome c peroxidase [bacterium]